MTAIEMFRYAVTYKLKTDIEDLITKEIERNNLDEKDIQIITLALIKYIKYKFLEDNSISE